MKWIEILRKRNIALLQNESDTQFVVAFNYDPTGTEDNQWSHGKYFEYWTPERKSRRLYDAVDAFRSRTEENYISHYRLEELATKFKNRIAEDAIDFAISDDEFLEFFTDECEMEECEMEFFGIPKTEEEEEK